MERNLMESPAEPPSSIAGWRTVGNALFSLVHAAAGDHRQ